jgi:hypothetical protein
LQSCNGCNPMCSKREEAKEKVGNQLSWLHFLAILLDEQQECWLPVISGVMPVMMKNRFSIIKEQEKWGILKRAYVQNNRFMGHPIFPMFGTHQNTITSHSSSPHNIACFAMGMQGNGLLKHPG